MKRRTFLSRSLVTLGAAACATPLVASLFGVKRYAPRGGLRLARRWDELEPSSGCDLAALRSAGATTPDEVRSLVDQALQALGGMGRFVRPGESVYVKPNIGWARRPELAATTNPEVVGELVRLAVEAGASKVTVGDRTCEEPRRCYEDSLIGPAVEAAGGSMVHSRAYTRVQGTGRARRDWLLDDNYLNADRVINVAIAKHHRLTGATLGMKNLYGVIGGERSRLHQQVHETVAELALLFRPTLSVVDGIRRLTTNGPQGGSLSYVEHSGAIVAGVDPVAVDAFALRELFRERYGGTSSLPLFVTRAQELGVGSADLERANIVSSGFGG